MPFVADKEGSLDREFAKTIIPRTYVIDQTGMIRFEIIGFDQEKLTELDAKISDFISVTLLKSRTRSRKVLART